MHKENKSEHDNGMTIIPVICEARQEFKSILSYIEGSRLAYAIEIIPSKNKHRKSGKEDLGHIPVYTSSMTECLPSTHQVLGSISRTAEPKTDNVMIAKHDH